MSDPYVASIVTSMPGGGQTKPFLSSEPPFNDDDLDQLALAMRTQGTWFMGRECRTEEQSRKVARDLLILCDIMRYYRLFPLDDGPLHPGWLPPGPPATGVVAGTPGYWLPEGATPPPSRDWLNYYAKDWVTTPWTADQYVRANNDDMCNYIGEPNPSDAGPWYVPWPKDNVMAYIYYAAEPTVTAQDQANANKLAGLGFVCQLNTSAMPEGDYFGVGPYRFTWKGSGNGGFAPVEIG